MRDATGKHIVSQLRKKWIFKTLLAQFFVALGFCLLLYTVLLKLYALPFLFFLPCLLIVFFILAMIDKKTRLTDNDVSRFLNINTAGLEESTHLLLKPQDSLNLLEKLQAKKVEHAIQNIKPPNPIKRQFAISMLILLLTSVISFALFKIPPLSVIANKGITSKQASSINTIPEKILPEIKDANITIRPPAYTGRGARVQDRFNLLAEEGADVTWQIQTNVPANEVSLLFNDDTKLLLSKDVAHLNWRTQKLINRPGFYQVKIDDNLSELYKIETIKDQSPTITIHAPKPNTNIKYGQSQIVLVTGILADDYGVKSAQIFATISSGQGEGVKFKEQKFSLTSIKPGQREYQLRQSLNCKSLGMQPGDELYFFISTSDNRNQETRSQVYIITLQDTANTSSMTGLVSPLDVQPDLFRSQRQIIIETEQLLKNKSRISNEAFIKKSNDLGVDQKLLRMRYGKFLGEENDVDIGGDHAHEEEGHVEEIQDIMEQYSHKHDNAEDASFFDAATKKQLKATLAEMWKAEMKLRTILPKEALPFEYKALQLLKDLQQKSRVYVAKTGLKTTPLSFDKRLTGDLSKVGQPALQKNIQKSESATDLVRKAMAVLEELKSNGKINASAKEVLQKAFYHLSVKASDQPALYIPSLSALKNIVGEKYRLNDIEHAQKGLQKMVAATEKLPYSPINASIGLSQQYFINLKSRQ